MELRLNGVGGLVDYLHPVVDGFVVGCVNLPTELIVSSVEWVVFRTLKPHIVVVELLHIAEVHSAASIMICWI